MTQTDCITGGQIAVLISPPTAYRSVVEEGAVALGAGDDFCDSLTTKGDDRPRICVVRAVCGSGADLTVGVITSIADIPTTDEGAATAGADGDVGCCDSEVDFCSCQSRYIPFCVACDTGGTMGLRGIGAFQTQRSQRRKGLRRDVSRLTTRSMPSRRQAVWKFMSKPSRRPVSLS